MSAPPTAFDDASPVEGARLPADPNPFTADQQDELEPPLAPQTFDEHRVVLILVAHNGMRWLPGSLAALGAQSRPPDVVVAVDTGSTDRTPELLANELGADDVVTLDRHVPFSAAVAAGVMHADAKHAVGDHPPNLTWIWVLHDDSAALPQALEHLLGAVDNSPSVGIVGPKVRGWADTRRLLEIGLTIAGSGRRETGLERSEQDQGQHDGRGDVLAVGSAGLLVRRSVWDELGGFDQRIRLFRDDIDLGWRANLAGHRVVVAPDAIVHHAEAATHRRRGRDAARHGLHRAEREASLHVLLANRAAWTLPWTYLRLTVATLLRTVGLFLTKAAGDAVEELGAYAAVVLRPDRVWRARRARRATKTVPSRELRPLMAPWGSQARHGLDTVSAVVAGNADRLRQPSARRASLDEPAQPLEEVDTRSRLRRVLARPGVLLFLGLLVIALVAVWPLVGRGLLHGGALLPARLGASDLFTAYRSSWHPVALGSTVDAPPSLWLLGVASLPFLGSVSLLVDVLLLLEVPLAGVSAYLALRRSGLHVLGRVWAGAAYALLPAATGAIATGRLGTVVVHLLLPPLVVAATRAPASTRAAAVAGLLLSVIVSFAPVVWPLAVVLVLVAIPFVGAWRPALRLALAALSPLLLLLPWSWQLLRQPSRFLVEAGAPTPELVEAVPAWQLPLFAPGGPGTPTPWLVVGLLIAGLAALLLSVRRRLVALTWALAVVALASAAVLARTTTTPPSTGIPQGVWTGPFMVLLGGTLVFTASLAAQGPPSFSSGRLQRLTVLVAIAAATMPLLLAGAWVLRGAEDPLVRGDGGVLPGRVAALLDDDRQQRALVLEPTPSGGAIWSLDGDDGPVLGEADVAPDADQVDHVDALVADLVGGRDVGDEKQRLADLAVSYVVFHGSEDDPIVQRLDGQPGLTRLPNVEEAPTWQVQERTGRVRIVREDGGVAVLRSPSNTVSTQITAGPAGRRLILAETADDGWRASFDGEPLEGTRYAGWAQSFDLPTSAGELEVFRERDRRGLVLIAEAVLVGLTVLLALPGRRPDEEES
ncbi:MAG: glycosyltransferase family 2 protein [Candidatus Nanopelagicales bacterium]